MGLVRLLLALAVVCAHVGYGDQLVGGRVAVQGFYLISGFLMAFILSRGSYTLSSFYLNRALRIYPLYWACALLMVGLWWLDGDKAATFGHLPQATQAFMTAANVGLFGQDWAMFLTPGLAFTPDFSATSPALHDFLLLPQAWTLGVELSFYLIAPFVVGRTRVLVAMVAVGLLSRMLAAGAGLDHDPWSYRFLPFELSLFALGALALRWLAPKVDTAKPWPVVGVAVAVILLFPMFAVPEPWRSVAVLSAMFLALPFLFAFQNGRRWDAALGELSYPLYLIHWPTLLIVRHLLERFGLPGAGPAFAGLAIVASLAAAVALNLTLARPIEALRARVRAGRALQPVTVPA